MGFDMQVCSMYLLRELVISCSLFCTFSHCVLVRCFCWSIFVRFSITRFVFQGMLFVNFRGF